MDDFTLATHISAPPKIAFAFLADVTNMTRWYEAVERVTLRAGAQVGPHSSFELVRSLPGGRVTNVVEITEYEPPRKLTLESRSGPTPFRYAYTLRASEQGTALTLEGRISAEGLPGPAGHLGPLASRLFARGMQRNLQTLKHLVEDDVPRRSSSCE